MVWKYHAVLLALDIHCQQPKNYLVHLNMLEFFNSACVGPIHRALRVLNSDGITVNASTILVKSLFSIKESTVDRDSTVCSVHLTETDVVYSYIDCRKAHKTLDNDVALNIRTHRNPKSVHNP